MVEGATILQGEIFTRFILPFFLVFFVLFAILEKTKLFGEGKKQVNAMISFVVGLIFVSVLYPTVVVSNLILFLTVALVCVFVILLIWGFIFGDDKGFKPEKWMKYSLAILAGIAFIVAVIWATGLLDNVKAGLFDKAWSKTFWTNFGFILAIAVALALVLIGGKAKKS
jgi:hypothetical protein